MINNRDRLQEKLSDHGIQTGFHYEPNHRLSFFREDGALPLPVTDEVSEKLLSLPLHPDLTVQQIELISEAVIREAKIC